MMLYVDRAIKQFWKQLAVVIAVKGDYVEYTVQMLNITSFHCS